MPASAPLKGIELIDCAKANAPQGVETAAHQCGYGQNTENFMQALQIACKEIGINIETIGDLITEQQMSRDLKQIEVAPDTPSEL
jgi:hypothetical protein